MAPNVAVVPVADDGIVEAVIDGGGRIADPSSADAIVWTHPLDAEGLRTTIAASPARWVQLPFAGIERFVEAGAIDPERTWTCTKGVYGYACAEHALGFMLAAARRFHEHARARSWREGGGGFGAPERMLRGATVVVVGTGGIGRELARVLEPFETRLIAVNRSGDPMPGADTTTTSDRLLEVLPETDFLVVAAALTKDTRHMIGPRALEALPSHAWVINVARGGLVDTDALVDALKNGSIAGAALDVTDPEPLPDGHPLWALPNVLITPHVANTWDMALPELRAMVARNVAHFGAGEPLEGLVDPALGY